MYKKHVFFSIYLFKKKKTSRQTCSSPDAYIAAWAKQRNKEKIKINWTFTKKKADEKLSKYYVA